MRAQQAATMGVGNLIGKTMQVGQFLVTIEKKLGQGGFADVYQVVSRQVSYTACCSGGTFKLNSRCSC